MRSPKGVLALGAALVLATVVALWRTADREHLDPADSEEVAPSPPPLPAPLAPGKGAGPADAASPVATRPADAGAPLSAAPPIRPGVNAPLPPDQWPARVRPSERTVVTPPPSEDLPEISREELREAVNAVRPLIARCFTDSAQKYLGNQKVVLRFTVQGQGLTGHFQDGEVVESTIVDPWVQACFLEALTDASFPSPSGGGPVTVTYPFSFVDTRDAGQR